MIHAQCSQERGGTRASVGVGKKGCPMGCPGAQELSGGWRFYNFTQACSLCVATEYSRKGMQVRRAGQAGNCPAVCVPGELWVMLSRTPL